MSNINESNASLLTSLSTNHFLRDCIDLAIDGFLFRGVKPSDHYYRFSQSFPRAFQLLSTCSNLNHSSTVLTTPKQSHHSHSSKHQRTSNVPPLDLSSLNSHVLLEQQPVSTIMSTNSTGITIKTKKPVYSPKDSISSSTTTDRRTGGSARRPGSSSSKTPLVTSNTPNTPLSAAEQSPSTKRAGIGASPAAELWTSPQQQLNSLEIEAREIQERMGKHRLKHGRPNELALMTEKQVYDEKCDMQQELLRFENKYSKPTTSEQKRIMKPLYDYYRQLKRLVEKQQQA